MKHIFRKTIALLVSLLIIACAIFSACNQQPVQTTSQPAKQQVVTIGMEQDMGSLDPGSVDGMYMVSFLVYESLVDLYPDFKKVPGLATSWQMSADGKTWSFNLRKGVKFHDGNPFNAQSVVTMINRNKKLTIPKYGFDLVQSMETPDDYTIRFLLSSPSYTFPSDMSMVFNAIVSPAALDSDGKKVLKASGTGPYKFVSWTKGQEVVLVRNDDYWGTKPQIEKVILKVIPDPQTRVMAIETGDIDLMLCNGQVPSQIQALKTNKDLHIASNVGGTCSLLFFNTFRQPFDDIRVRQAISSAIDVEGSVTKLLADMVVPANYVFSSRFQEFVNPNAVARKYNVAEAKKLLGEAGWQDSDNDGILDKDGKRLEMTLTYDTNDLTYRMLAEAFQSQLKEAGIDVKLTAVEFGAYYKLLANKKYDLMLTGQWFIPHDDPSQFYKNYYTAEGFYPVYNSDDMEQLIGKLQVCVDTSERLKLHYELQKHILDNALMIPVYYKLNVWVISNNIEGFKPYPGFWHLYKPLLEARVK